MCLKPRQVTQARCKARYLRPPPLFVCCACQCRYLRVSKRQAAVVRKLNLFGCLFVNLHWMGVVPRGVSCLLLQLSHWLILVRRIPSFPKLSSISMGCQCTKLTACKSPWLMGMSSTPRLPVLFLWLYVQNRNVLCTLQCPAACSITCHRMWFSG